MHTDRFGAGDIVGAVHQACRWHDQLMILHQLQRAGFSVASAVIVGGIRKQKRNVGMAQFNQVTGHHLCSQLIVCANKRQAVAVLTTP